MGCKLENLTLISRPVFIDFYPPSIQGKYIINVDRFTYKFNRNIFKSNDISFRPPIQEIENLLVRIEKELLEFEVLKQIQREYKTYSRTYNAIFLFLIIAFIITRIATSTVSVLSLEIILPFFFLFLIFLTYYLAKRKQKEFRINVQNFHRNSRNKIAQILVESNYHIGNSGYRVELPSNLDSGVSWLVLIQFGILVYNNEQNQIQNYDESNQHFINNDTGNRNVFLGDANYRVNEQIQNQGNYQYPSEEYAKIHTVMIQPN